MSQVLSFCKRFLVVAAILIAIHASAQENYIQTATWIMPGISWTYSNKMRLFTQVGINDYQDMAYVFTQGFYSLNKHITVSAGHSYLQSDGSVNFRQHDILAAAAFSHSFGKIIVEDRNMFKKMLISNNPSTHVYRNRIRAGYPFSLYSNKGSIYVVDEGYYSLDNGRWSRNRIGLGINYTLSQNINLDVSYLRQKDVISGRINLIFIQLTSDFQSKKTK